MIHYKGHKVFLKDGYECTMIDGKFKYIHRLIMEDYLGRKLEIWENVHHKDEDIINNDISNFEVLHEIDHAKLHYSKLSEEEKKIRSKKISIKTKGSKNSQAKINEDQVIDIKKRLLKKETMSSIAKIHNIGGWIIQDINTGKSWSHVKM